MSEVILKNVFWPSTMGLIAHEGFDDEMLEWLCSNQIHAFDRSKGFKKSGELYWTQSIYSLGKCYRAWLNWPRWLPVPAFSDHGVWQSFKFGPHEIDNGAKLHLSWNSRKVANGLVADINVLKVQHPWVHYRKCNKIRMKSGAKGTLVFLPHTVDGVDIEGDWKNFFVNLKSLDRRLWPLTLCMHMHDVRKGLHKQLRIYGFPIVTAGETLSDCFIDRFYDLITSFEYATSVVGGSELFFCEEVGVKFFIFGSSDLALVNKTRSDKPIGRIKKVGEDAVADKRKRELFSTIPPSFSPERKEFVRLYLGTDGRDTSSKRNVLLRLLHELLRVSPFVLRYFFVRFVRLLFRPLRSLLRRRM